MFIWLVLLALYLWEGVVRLPFGVSDLQCPWTCLNIHVLSAAHCIVQSSQLACLLGPGPQLLWKVRLYNWLGETAWFCLIAPEEWCPG